ncbi:MAG: dienelactone hydrolase family protein, partial [Pseudomonadales bacterium]|nr:dienelactone hydrolase family protein [Pseudomonadales bacterium]
MCDDDTLADDARWRRSGSTFSRRTFHALAAGTAAALVLPQAATASSSVPVTERDVRIETPDGVADAFFVHPAEGRHPAVLVWPDILGLRPAFRQMGRRLAEAGYAVLVINPFYRSAEAPVVGPGASFQDPEVRERVLPLARSLTAATTDTDAEAFVTFLDAQDAVDTDRGIGTTGYCMGGPMVLRTAALRPDRIAAGATFHGSRLVTDDEDSPHRSIADAEARFLIAIAENDDERDPDAKDVLRDAFDAAGLTAEIEVYAGAMHGWCALDSAVYHEAQAER